jgi:nucleotide-binding universal stress UspA family protein
VDKQARQKEAEGAAEGAKVKDAYLVFGKPDIEIVKLGEELEAGPIVLGSRCLHVKRLGFRSPPRSRRGPGGARNILKCL